MTRASLLFARQVVLVEGIAEALLIRAIAEYVLFPASLDGTDEAPCNRQHREQFRAISVHAIGGVDFVPFLRLLLHDQIAVVDRVVVVTDGDDGAGWRRRAAIGDAFPSQLASGLLSVEVGATTLEAELYALAETSRC